MTIFETEKMKALCPHCGGEGCEKCIGGYTSVGFATGMLWTRSCESCGYENGGHIVSKGTDAPLEDPAEWGGCVMCSSEKVTWKLVGNMQDL